MKNVLHVGQESLVCVLTRFLECTFTRMSSSLVRLTPQSTHIWKIVRAGSQKQTSYPRHIKQTACQWQENPPQKSDHTKSVVMANLGQRVYLQHVLTLAEQRRRSCGLWRKIPLSSGSHNGQKYIHFYLNGAVWGINLSAYKHTNPSSSIVGLSVNSPCWNRFRSFMYHCCQC